MGPEVRVMGVEVEASGPFTKSLAAGRLVSVDVRPSVASGLTGKLDPATITLDIVPRVVDEMVVVDKGDLRRAFAVVPRVPTSTGRGSLGC